MTSDTAFLAAAVQLDAGTAATTASTISNAIASGADLIVLPELFRTGYLVDGNVRAIAEPAEGETTTLLRQWSSESPSRTTFVTAIVESDGADLYDTAIVVDDTGLRGHQRKLRLWGDERRYLKPGRTVEPIPSRVGNVGICTCYDAGFPEVARQLALAGADFLAVPAAFGMARLHAWDVMTRARALENGLPLVAAGFCGEAPSGLSFAGHTRIVGADGRIRAEQQAGAGWVSQSFVKDEIARARLSIPYLADLHSI